MDRQVTAEEVKRKRIKTISLTEEAAVMLRELALRDSRSDSSMIEVLVRREFQAQTGIPNAEIIGKNLA